MNTEINWIDPHISPPSFNERILVLVGGTGTNDAARTWHKYVQIFDVVMLESSPNDLGDDGGDSVFDEFLQDDSANWDDYQFHLIQYHEHKFGDDEEYLDWYSDSIVRWADIPDFSEVLKAP